MLIKGKIDIHHAMGMSMLQYPPVHNYCLHVCGYVYACVCVHIDIHVICAISVTGVYAYL